MLDNLGRVVDEDTRKVKQWSIRDFFVLAALDEKDYPEPQFLVRVVKQSINSGIKNKIKSLNEILERD